MIKHLDSVFIQPTYECAKNCRGCYVKESRQLAPQMDLSIFTNLLYYLFSGNGKIRPKQITIALDAIPSYSSVNSPIVHMMRKMFERSLLIKEELNSDIELHFTTNSFNDLLPYAHHYLNSQDLDYYSVLKDRRINVLSVSNIRFGDTLNIGLRLGPGPIINYNYTVPLLDNKNVPLSSERWNSVPVIVRQYINIVKETDMSYLVLHKSGLGRKMDELSIKSYKAFLYFLTRSSDYREVKDKIVIDSCVVDSFESTQNGNGCGANIKKIHIWPDGHVSGCPYNMDGGDGISCRTFEHLLNNIEAAFDVYDFKKCTIPKDYFTNKKQSLAVIK